MARISASPRDPLTWALLPSPSLRIRARVEGDGGAEDQDDRSGGNEGEDVENRKGYRGKVGTRQKGGEGRMGGEDGGKGGGHNSHIAVDLTEASLTVSTTCLFQNQKREERRRQEFSVERKKERSQSSASNATRLKSHV
ncbi:hypothetical protein C0989_003659 [Termitomyces sp. Mn162]|nr:hypothetical protein C0989_003659 [Termitomyces sp. Mn162]